MSSEWKRRFGRLMYALAVRVRGEESVYDRAGALRRLQTQPRDVVLSKQCEMLADTLEYALVNVPQYRGWAHLADGLNASNAADRLRALPILEKAVLQERPSRLRSEAWTGRSSKKTTGGSTGAPVTLLKNPAAIAQEMAATWLGYGWFDVGIGDRCVRFWGQPQRNLKRRLRYVAADLAVNRKTLSAFGYSRADLAGYVEQIERFRPAYLYGYVSALEELARYMTDTGLRFDKDPHHVVTTAEVLTAPQRRLMETAFGASVQNEYGCGEFGPIAYECPRGSLHLLPTNQFIEIVAEDGSPAAPGDAGAIVVTDLTNRVMPLIRYRVGDMGAFGDPCPCGRAFPVLDRVFGREYDSVGTPDGRRFHGEFFMYIFEDLRERYPQIGQFKVIQDGPASLSVRVVATGTGSTAAMEEGIRRELQSRMPDMTTSVERVTALERRASGKMRVVENRYEERNHSADG